jgi:glucose-1-phosphate thymidylyltransferase
MKGLLLAGGHGTRLRPLTFSGNKHMLPIANQPILFYGLKHFARAGIRDVGVILGPIQEGIRESIGDGAAFGLRVQYIEQGAPKGLAHAVLCAREFLGDDPFVMYLGDNLLQEGVESFVRMYNDQHPDAVVGATPVANPKQYGIIELDGNRIVSIEEKPAVPRSDLALIGVYLFDPAIHPVIADLKPSKRGELEITDAIWQLHHLRHRVIARRVDGWWKDTGRPEDLLEANELVLRTYPADQVEHGGSVAAGAEVQGTVSIGRGSVVEKGARILGPAILGSDVKVGPETQIGPGTSIGNGVSLSQVSIRRSIVQDGARIQGPIRLFDSLIGKNVEIRFRSDVGHDVSLTLGDSSRIVA